MGHFCPMCDGFLLQKRHTLWVRESPIVSYYRNTVSVAWAIPGGVDDTPAPKRGWGCGKDFHCPPPPARRARNWQCSRPLAGRVGHQPPPKLIDVRAAKAHQEPLAAHYAVHRRDTDRQANSRSEHGMSRLVDCQRPLLASLLICLSPRFLQMPPRSGDTPQIDTLVGDATAVFDSASLGAVTCRHVATLKNHDPPPTSRRMISALVWSSRGRARMPSMVALSVSGAATVPDSVPRWFGICGFTGDSAESSSPVTPNGTSRE